MLRWSELPPEILHLIFVKGCEDDDGTLDPIMYLEPPDDDSEKALYSPYPRRLKVFAGRIRQICRKWRSEIDSQRRFCLSHYWISHLALITDLYATEAEKTKFSDGQSIPFVKQLIYFRKLLSDSQGCDLVITIATPSTKEWALDPRSLPTKAATMLRLLIYGMQALMPYREQIINLQVFTVQPQILNYTMGLLAGLENGCRLISVSLLTHPTESFGFAAPSFSEITDRIAERPLISLQNHYSMPQIPSPLCLSHLSNIDTLCIASILWLKGSILLPKGITNISTSEGSNYQ